ncbi:hypothetical protein D9M68_774690 [compost metagenome]
MILLTAATVGGEGANEFGRGIDGTVIWPAPSEAIGEVDSERVGGITRFMDNLSRLFFAGDICFYTL